MVLFTVRYALDDQWAGKVYITTMDDQGDGGVWQWRLRVEEAQSLKNALELALEEASPPWVAPHNG